MSTEWRNTETGQVVAVTRFGGVERGRLVEVECCTAEEWNQVQEVESESGEVVAREELEARGEVVPWTRWRANARSREWQEVAERWAAEAPEVAHFAAARAQAFREEAVRWS